jgi:serine/threonine protein kinase
LIYNPHQHGAGSIRITLGEAQKGPVLNPGAKLGPYEITSSIGAGGMGEVYRARDTRLDRTVAIKILPVQVSSDPVRKQRFEREAKTISSLNHPHICMLHDLGSQNGIEYLVMECIEGEALLKRLDRGPLPLEQVEKYGAQIADALDKAHRCGVVHRDLKPGNIMLTATGAKLLDFGLAKTAVALHHIYRRISPELLLQLHRHGQPRKAAKDESPLWCDIGHNERSTALKPGPNGRCEVQRRGTPYRPWGLLLTSVIKLIGHDMRRHCEHKDAKKLFEAAESCAHGTRRL